MGRRTLAELAETAMRRGLDPATPAVAIIETTRPQQQVVTATITDIAARLDEAAPDGPVLIMIGRALADVLGGPSARTVGGTSQFSGALARRN
jgi:uroporphyrin-III C-methyltransferase/precorrin-2 dehydrogenase/sirohydrochlorin ferrochelatase